MSKSAISFRLSKAMHGDISFITGLCSHLSKHSVYLPVLDVHEDEETGIVRVSILSFLEGEKKVVPVWATEKGFLEWQRTEGRGLDGLALPGADLCAALSEEIWLSLDSGNNNNVSVSLEMIRRIACASRYHTAEAGQRSRSHSRAVDEEPSKEPLQDKEATVES